MDLVRCFIGGNCWSVSQVCPLIFINSAGLLDWTSEDGDVPCEYCFLQQWLVLYKPGILFFPYHLVNLNVYRSPYRAIFSYAVTQQDKWDESFTDVFQWFWNPYLKELTSVTGFRKSYYHG